MKQAPVPVETTDARPRPAEVTDLPMLYRSELQYMREIEPASVSAWMNAIDRNLELWTQNLSRSRVIDVRGRPTGIKLWMRATETAAVLVTIHVLPEARRCGIGKRLLHQFISDATGDGLSLLTLGVHQDNPIKSLYERAGFRYTNTEGQYLHYEMHL